jgi:hypothetical protein
LQRRRKNEQLQRKGKHIENKVLGQTKENKKEKKHKSKILNEKSLGWRHGLGLALFNGDIYVQGKNNKIEAAVVSHIAHDIYLGELDKEPLLG